MNWWADSPEAIRDYEAALATSPQFWEAHNNMAWIRAASADAQYRNGAKLLEHARQAYRLGVDPQGVSDVVFAAAHAEAGEFDQAVQRIMNALSNGKYADKDRLGRWLDSYKQKKPYRRDPVVVPSEVTAGPGGVLPLDHSPGRSSMGVLASLSLCARGPPLLAGGSRLMADEPSSGPVEVERQPFVAATERLLQALVFIGSPLPGDDAQQLNQAMQNADPKASVADIQKVLDRHCLAFVRINPESRVSAAEGPVRKELIQQGWRTFLVKIHNEARITPELKVESPSALPLHAAKGPANALDGRQTRLPV